MILINRIITKVSRSDGFTFTKTTIFSALMNISAALSTNIKQLNFSFNILTTSHPLTQTHFMFSLLLILPIFLVDGFSLIIQEDVSRRKSLPSPKTQTLVFMLCKALFLSYLKTIVCYFSKRYLERKCVISFRAYINVLQTSLCY